MSASPWRSVTSLRGSPSLLPVARAMLDAIGLGGVALPESHELAPGRRWTREAGDLKVSLGVDRYGVDPYAGGPTRSEWLRVDAPDRELRVSVSEIAWVGPELEVNARGPRSWVAAVAAAERAYLEEREE